MQKKLFSVLEAAELLSLDKNAVYALIKAGILVPLKIKTYKLSGVELDNFAEEWRGWDLSDPVNPVRIKRGEAM